MFSRDVLRLESPRSARALRRLLAWLVAAAGLAAAVQAPKAASSVVHAALPDADPWVCALASQALVAVFFLVWTAAAKDPVGPLQRPGASRSKVVEQLETVAFALAFLAGQMASTPAPWNWDPTETEILSLLVAVWAAPAAAAVVFQGAVVASCRRAVGLVGAVVAAAALYAASRGGDPAFLAYLFAAGCLFGALRVHWGLGSAAAGYVAFNVLAYTLAGYGLSAACLPAVSVLLAALSVAASLASLRPAGHDRPDSGA